MTEEGFTYNMQSAPDPYSADSYSVGADGFKWDDKTSDPYSADNYSAGESGFEWSGRDDSGFSFDTSFDWADDSETPEEDGSWMEAAWDFASSDRMLDFLLGAGSIGMGMLDSKPVYPSRSSGGSGGSSKTPPKNIDIGKLTSKPKVIASRR